MQTNLPIMQNAQAMLAYPPIVQYKPQLALQLNPAVVPTVNKIL